MEGAPSDVGQSPAYVTPGGRSCGRPESHRAELASYSDAVHAERPPFPGGFSFAIATLEQAAGRGTTPRRRPVR